MTVKEVLLEYREVSDKLIATLQMRVDSLEEHNKLLKEKVHLLEAALDDCKFYNDGI